MTRNHSDTREFEYNVARDLLGWMPGALAATARLANPPEPDIVVPNASIGIEVTKLHPGGEPARKWEGTQDAILKLAARLHGDAGRPPVEVIVCWSAWMDPAAVRKQSVARELTDFVFRNLPSVNQCLEFTILSGDGPKIPHAIESLSIRRFAYEGTVGDTNHWHAPRGAFLPTIGRDVIQARLDAKEKRVVRWNARYEQLWLLLAFGREGPSSWGLMRDDWGTHRFRSSAARAFVIGMPNEVAELALARVG